MKFLFAYRSYLQGKDERAPDLLSPWEFLSRFNSGARLAGDYFSADSAIVTFEEVAEYAKDTRDYIEKFSHDCDSPRHTIHLRLIVRTLEKLMQHVRRERDNNGKKNFADVRDMIRARAFRTELEILLDSLIAAPRPLKVFFSDNGFASLKNKMAVWCEDSVRREIADVIRMCKEASNLHSFYRILLLKSLDVEDYDGNDLYQLCRDIVFLLENFIDVAIGSEVLAQRIGDDFFNYAIIEDGTIMQANAEHVIWRIAKVPTHHPEFERIFEEYRSLLKSGVVSALTFKSSEYLKREDWGLYNEEEKVRRIILPQLEERMSQITSDVLKDSRVVGRKKLIGSLRA